MRVTNILKVDPKGRITIPLVLREALGIQEGRLLLAIADTEKKELVITPLVPSEKQIYEIKVELSDKPGALADLSERLREMKLDQILTRCAVIRRGEVAECIFVVEPLETPSVDVEAVKKELEALETVYFITIKPLGK
ncbi:MAG: hypothetical protein QXU97_01380 [Fervidicoccaceae archaeon]